MVFDGDPGSYAKGVSSCILLTGAVFIVLFVERRLRTCGVLFCYSVKRIVSGESVPLYAEFAFRMFSVGDSLNNSGF